MYYQSKCAASKDIFLLNIRRDPRKNTEKKRRPPKMIGLRVTNLDLHDASDSTYNWLRSSEKNNRLSAAPDHIYLNTYCNKTTQEEENIKSKSTNHCSSSVGKSRNFNSYEQYGTIYDYIRQSIRLIEQQRNVKEEILSYRIQRPFNEDHKYRRINQRDKRSSAVLPPLSHCSSLTTQTQSTIFPSDLRSHENLRNYINHSRGFHSTQSSVVSHDSNKK